MKLLKDKVENLIHFAICAYLYFCASEYGFETYLGFWFLSFILVNLLVSSLIVKIGLDLWGKFTGSMVLDVIAFYLSLGITYFTSIAIIAPKKYAEIQIRVYESVPDIGFFDMAKVKESIENNKALVDVGENLTTPPFTDLSVIVFSVLFYLFSRGLWILIEWLRQRE
ncbi:hypothetical protein [Echinimonas agarilytica]|uniref:Uncharacterized protein n=1 Tax=Echinimonas agarilytica TaxID=1215918 RepID=A0AA41W912_9GAMM|nr:hypothetical protein [Echinimonas agarilytica]MCM2681552.1 hypothetical protein [Echinimonas agarilytica]